MHEVKKLLEMLNEVLPPVEPKRHGIMLIDDKLTIQLAVEDGFRPVNITGEDLGKRAAEIVVLIIAAMRKEDDRNDNNGNQTDG